MSINLSGIPSYRTFKAIANYSESLNEAFAQGDMTRALGLIVKYLEKKLGKLYQLPEPQQFTQNISGEEVKMGIRYTIKGGKNVRFNWSKSYGGEIESIDIWDGTGPNPDVHVDVKGLSVVKILPAIVELIKTPTKNPTVWGDEEDFRAELNKELELTEGEDVGEEDEDEANEATNNALDLPEKISLWIDSVRAFATKAKGVKPHIILVTGGSSIPAYTFAEGSGRKGDQSRFDTNKIKPASAYKVQFEGDASALKKGAELLSGGRGKLDNGEPDDDAEITRYPRDVTVIIDEDGDAVLFAPLTTVIKMFGVKGVSEEEDNVEETEDETSEGRALDPAIHAARRAVKDAKRAQREAARAQRIAAAAAKKNAAITRGKIRETRVDAKADKAEADFDKMQYADPEYVFKDLKMMVNFVAKGTRPSLIVCGMAGIGKTYDVSKTLEEAGLKKDVGWVHVKGKATPLGVYAQLYYNSDKVVVFDDCDSVLKDADAINILKGALDSYDERIISWFSKSTFDPNMYDAEETLAMLKSGKYPNQFEFKGGCIFISNLPMHKMDSALTSRSFTIDIQLTARDVVKRIQSIMVKMDLALSIPQRQELLDKILEMVENRKIRKTMSIRLFINAIPFYESGDPDWKRQVSLYA